MTSKFSRIYLLVTPLVLISTKPAFSQLHPSQVVTLTVGNQGTVQTTRTFKEKDNEQIFSFSLATEDKRLRNKNKKKKRQSQTQTEYDFNVSASSFVLESGKRREVKRVKIVDTYDYLDSSFNQSLSIDY